MLDLSLGLFIRIAWASNSDCDLCGLQGHCQLNGGDNRLVATRSSNLGCGATLPIRIAKQALHVNQCAVRKPVCWAGVIDRLCRQSMRCAVPDLADSGCGAHKATRASHPSTGAKYKACKLKKVDAWNSATTGASCREPAPGYSAARISRPNWSQCAKSHAAWQSLSSRAEKLRIFSKIFFHFLTIFFKLLVISLPFSRCWPYFEAGMLFGGFSSTRVTRLNLDSEENPYFEKLANLWQIWPYSRYSVTVILFS